MSWHTQNTTTSTLPATWHYYSEMVVPMFLVLNYRLQPLYILDSSLVKKPKHPE